MRISDWSSDVCSSDLLVSLDTLDWDEELLDTFHVPRAMLPEIRSSSEVYGHAQDTLWAVPVAAALGDQQAALVGQGCLSPGQDRKGVVKGKRASVCVDPRGRRIIKKKKKKNLT